MMRAGPERTSPEWCFWGLFAAIAVLLAGCAGGAEPDPTPETTELETVTTVEDQAQATVTTTTPSAPDPEDDPDPGEGAEGEFCQMMAEENLQTYEVFDPATVETYFTENLEFLSGLDGRVPEEIDDDFEVVHRNAVELAALVAEYDYEIMAVPEDQLAAMASDEVLEASTRIRDYCGLDLG